MKLTERDETILYYIVKHCDEVEFISQAFDRSYTTFKNNFLYMNACSMSIFQIGELSGRLSKEFIDITNDIPWKDIKGMRTFFAHEYERMDSKIIWDVAVHDIPILNRRCKSILLEQGKSIPPKIKIPNVNTRNISR